MKKGSRSARKAPSPKSKPRNAQPGVSSEPASPPPRSGPTIRRVDVPWSENGAVPIGGFSSLWEADAALARAFSEEPPPTGGGYDKTGFQIVWTDGMTHEGRVDVTPELLKNASGRGGIIRAHVEDFAHYLLSERHATFWKRNHGDGDDAGLEERQAWGRELLTRLETDAASHFERDATRNADSAAPASYAGGGVPRLPAPRRRGQQERVELDVNTTFQPDPGAHLRELWARFRDARGSDDRDPAGWLPAMQIGDVTRLANHVTHALRADLPSFDRRDAAVIWEKWRLIVKWLRGVVHRYPDTDRMPDLIRFDVQISGIVDDLIRAAAAPGDVALHNCPWVADFFTTARLYPESV